MKQYYYLFCLVIWLLFFPGMSLYAATITGDAGFKLGDILDIQKSAAQKLTIEKDTVYKIIPESSANNIAYVLLRITRDKRIHRITVYSNEMTAAQCDTEKNALRKAVELKHPNLGYYAMDESEMFFDEPRTFTIECVVSGRNNRLKTEYSDDALAKLN